MSRRPVIFISMMLTMLLSQLPAIAGPGTALAPTDAKLTEAHGAVFKRDFTDWTKEALADPAPASLGEILHEGMQIGTADKSWAQLSWQHLSARVWSNSVYAISPNQRLVYLVGGEMLYHLDKNRKDKSPYYVWTNLLQARIRGTTVLFQCTKDTSRITVLEGTVEVLNRVDRSRVTLKPGVVYEIKAKDTASSGSPSLTNITFAPARTIFETTKTTASAAPVDPMAVMNHGLLREFESPLPSLPLVSGTMSTIQGTLEGAGKTLNNVINSLLKDNLEIGSVPRALSYAVGNELQNIASSAPGVFDFFAPAGVVGQPLGALPGNLVAGAGKDLPLNSGNLAALQAVPASTLLNVGAATGTIGTMTTSTVANTAGFATTTAASLATIGGGRAANLVTGAAGVSGGALPAVGGTTNGLVNTTTGLVNTTTGLINNTVGGLFGH